MWYLFIKKTNDKRKCYTVMTNNTCDCVPVVSVTHLWRCDDNYNNGGDADVPCSCTARLCTTILGVVIHRCRRHAAPTQAQVRLHWTAWRSNLPSVNNRRSCFSCCWCKGVERPAMRCDISFDAGGVQEQTQDVLAPPLLRNCFALDDTFFSQ